MLRVNNLQKFSAFCVQHKTFESVTAISFNKQTFSIKENPYI